jgi:hypothetical protein
LSDVRAQAKQVVTLMPGSHDVNLLLVSLEPAAWQTAYLASRPIAKHFIEKIDRPRHVDELFALWFTDK